ncbi:MAG: 30S ribosomal protein S8 [Candidatus Yanofskybacteria bacterium CG10_big_fil_rev_8_21_14_0_10_36_16]|uniref:Small ribosomal subunit protein uS8 n=1 Tax=Candidatus Yanofskybacteria bacterium CG10_big_fil_rev_8_21_14_0_10_36_16 TaxID=1975096 RepID=A0A2J0Q8L1_9BACT|nr:MAG: 30S ribosomal protein S8 [Candidatus Yanofskybacteria bacterium CG10_big_fil_rev_8_21_14_0_10_36_16]
MYTLANMLIQIKNAQAVGHERVLVPFSKMNLAVSETLKEIGFIDEIDKKKKKMKKSEVNFIDIKLKYKDGEGLINGIKIISRPSRRIYSTKDNIEPVMSGYGKMVLTTTKGVMTGDQAKKEGLGGEVLFKIW